MALVSNVPCGCACTDMNDNGIYSMVMDICYEGRYKREKLVKPYKAV